MLFKLLFLGRNLEIEGLLFKDERCFVRGSKKRFGCPLKIGSLASLESASMVRGFPG